MRADGHANEHRSLLALCRKTALYLASENGHTASVKALLENGADVNATNSDG